MIPSNDRARPPLILVVLVFGLLLCACGTGVSGDQPKFMFDPNAPADPPIRPILEFEDDDRIMILAPHPDDEILATGGVIQEALKLGLPVEVVFYTSGDNNEFAFLIYSKVFTLDPRSARAAGQVRSLEALQAGRELGLSIRDEFFLGYPDFGTMEIWLNRWGPERERFVSMFTEAGEVPYWFAQTPGAVHKGESIMKDLELALLDFQPTVLFLSHTADTNPDHAALNLFTRTVLWDLEEQIQPRVYAFLTHYGDWPQPAGLYSEGPLEPPAKFDEAGRWVVLRLTSQEVARKLEAIKRHDTQYTASPDYLESFMRSNELFDPVEPIPLHAESPVLLLPSGTGVLQGEQLPEGAWTDTAERHMQIEGDKLIFSIELVGDVVASLEIDVYVSGYRYDLSFAEMPKYHLEAGRAGLKVEERRELVAESGVELSRSPGVIELRIPLDTLWNPDKIFFSVGARANGKDLDTLDWVVLDLRGDS
ncbi:MAG: PIG-L deacetylase family protein [Anaerolineales bacterium]